MNKVQTDNSYLAEKIELRINNLPNKPVIKVLDCYRGEGVIWENIADMMPDKKFIITGIDKKKDRNGIYLIGDNLKFISRMDLSSFDVIDLDAYGIPLKQLEAIIDNNTSTGVVVFVTAIQSIFGKIPTNLLVCLGYTEKMIKKIPTIFNHNLIDKICNWLGLKGIKTIKIYSDFSGRKNYFCFKI